MTRTPQAGETLQNLPEITQSNPGRVLFVNKDGAANLSAGLRLYEVLHSDMDAWTEILAAEESRFRVRVYEEGTGVSNALPLTELELTAASLETGTFRFHRRMRSTAR